MTEEEMQTFVATTAAATLANKAVLTLSLGGVPVNRENCAAVYGQWLSADSPFFAQLVDLADRHVAQMMDTACRLRDPALGC